MTPRTKNAEVTDLKGRLKSMWMAGDYDRFSRQLKEGPEQMLERLAIPAGASVLDVACGSGAFALLAAREGAEVTGIDLADYLIERARARAQEEGLSIRFEQGDVEALPFEDDSFDYVVSLIGAMFAPRPELVVSEMLRVCRPQGVVAMANWTPEGFVGKMFKVVASHISPPGMPSPLLWGSEEVVRKRFAEGVAYVQVARRYYLMEYPFPPSEVVEFYRQLYGPVNRAFAALDDEGQKKLRADLEGLWASHNEATDGSTRVHAEYLQVVATRIAGFCTVYFPQQAGEQAQLLDLH
jgi:ubiquinone/menaquinone biosynthesis C-methylase UbiE